MLAHKGGNEIAMLSVREPPPQTLPKEAHELNAACWGFHTTNWWQQSLGIFIVLVQCVHTNRRSLAGRHPPLIADLLAGLEFQAKGGKTKMGGENPGNREQENLSPTVFSWKWWSKISPTKNGG